ncbi:4Fe-4S dicluster domain-containing protein [Candidatus Omnitrophota bacterium]
MSKYLVLQKTNFKVFLDNLSEQYSVYVPTKKKNQRFYKRYENNIDDVIVGEVRTFEPLKAFFSLARELVAEGFKEEVSQDKTKPLAILGVKACDLKGFKVQDFVFTNADLPDPFYVKNREANLVISADCTCVIETCFCVAAQVTPFPQENFDINFSELNDVFLIEVGSEKGQKIVDMHPSLFTEASKEMLDEREALRAKVVGAVEENIQNNAVPMNTSFKGIIEKNYESELWEDEAKTCVECGACNTICPTCHCFLLYDQKDKDKMARLRVWDSCMVKDFARVAGGANPRARLWMRLRNRFEKKFDFFPKVSGIYACTGCGRCISACPAKIDIRKVLQRLVSNG